MPEREIKTTIKLDGEKEFKKAIVDANREMRLMGAELKEVASEFDITGDSQRYYTRRSETLKREMQQQRNIIAALEGAVRDLGQKHGAASKEVQSMTIELTNARTKLNRIQKEFNENEKAARDFGKSLDKNVEDEAKQAGKAVKNLDKDLDGLDGELGGIKGAIDGLKGLKGLDIGMDIFGNVPDWVNQVLEWGEEGRGYQRQQAELHYTTQWAGADEEAVREQINEVAAVTQDRESAQAGVQMLINIDGIDEPMLETIVDNLMGADILMPELEFGQLAEGFQESASSGQLAGPFMELLERSGFESDEIEGINDELANLRTERERANLLLTKLAEIRGADGETGLVDVYRQYRQEQAPVIAAERSSQALEEATKKMKASSTWQNVANDLAYGKLGLFSALTGDNEARLEYDRAMWEEAERAVSQAMARDPQNWYEAWKYMRGEELPEGYDPQYVSKKAPLFGLNNEPIWLFGGRTEWGESTKHYKQRMEQAEDMGDFSGKIPGGPVASDTPRRLSNRKKLAGKAADTQEMSLWEEMTVEPQALWDELGDRKSITPALTVLEQNLGEMLKNVGETGGENLGSGIEEGGKEAIEAMEQVLTNLSDIVGSVVMPPIQIPVTASAGGYGGNVYLDGRQVGKVMGPGVNRYLGRQS